MTHSHCLIFNRIPVLTASAPVEFITPDEQYRKERRLPTKEDQINPRRLTPDKKFHPIN